MLFSKEGVEEALGALVTELVAEGAEATIRVVGGAAVALQVGREALTGDIDALHASSPEVRAAVQCIAEARNWPKTWLNDTVKMYVSHHDTHDDWELRIDEGGVAVLVARPEILLAIKLDAGRGRRDADDIDRLLDACGITSVIAALELFDRYYPAEDMAAPAVR
ncbi:MAG: DUF6036 family nucleotidyltransferase [Acidimicrobiales bacterium]